MVFRIETLPVAERNIQEAYGWKRQRSARGAERWYQGLRRALQTLDNQPLRCAVAPESEPIGEEVRELLYGKRRNIYRILFAIRSDTVTILHVRHSARGFLEQDG